MVNDQLAISNYQLTMKNNFGFSSLKIDHWQLTIEN